MPRNESQTTNTTPQTAKDDAAEQARLDAIADEQARNAVNQNKSGGSGEGQGDSAASGKPQVGRDKEEFNLTGDAQKNGDGAEGDGTDSAGDNGDVEKAEKGPEFHTTVQDESFADVAAKHGIAHGDLAKLNPKINPHFVLKGTKLRLRKA